MLFPNLAKHVFEKIQIWEQLPNFKFQFSAILKIIWPIWEDGSRTVNNDEPDLRLFHGNFWPVMSQAVRKPCFSTSMPRGKFLDFQTPTPPALAPPPDGLSNPDPAPSQRTQGWNTSARKPSLLTYWGTCFGRSKTLKTLSQNDPSRFVILKNVSQGS